MEEVAEFTYLRSKLIITGSCGVEMRGRSSKTCQVFGVLKSSLNAKNIFQKSKTRLVKKQCFNHPSIS